MTGGGDAPAKLDDDAPLSFEEAARILLRGVVTASTLRAAWERRELTAERLGRRVVTTPRAVREWRASKTVRAEPKRAPFAAEPQAVATPGYSAEDMARDTLNDLNDALKRGAKSTRKGPPLRLLHNHTPPAPANSHAAAEFRQAGDTLAKLKASLPRRRRLSEDGEAE